MGWKLALMTCSGNFITIFVVSPDSFSFGTRTSNLAKPPASHSRGFTVTWAAATGAHNSAAAGAITTGVTRTLMDNTLLSESISSDHIPSSIDTWAVSLNDSNSPRRTSTRISQSPAGDRFAALTTYAPGSIPRRAL